jgi:hypothetical protein
MSQPLRRGVRAVSWTRVLPPRARQWLPMHRGWQTRCLQIRAAPAEQPASGNGSNLPVVGTPSSAESAGMSPGGPTPTKAQMMLILRPKPSIPTDTDGLHIQMRDSMSLAPHTLYCQSRYLLHRIFSPDEEPW